MRRATLALLMAVVGVGCGASDVSPRDVRSKESQINAATQHQPDVDFSGREQGQ